MHSQQQEYVNNMAFDFNPTSDFSDQSTNALYPSLPSQGHLTFPMGPDDVNIDAMDIQAVLTWLLTWMICSVIATYLTTWAFSVTTLMRLERP